MFHRSRSIACALLLLVAPIVALAAVPALAHAADSQTVKTPHLEVQLVSQTVSAAPGSTVYVALRQKILPEWHTYWRNPGDAGEPTTLKWTLPQGWKAGEFVWPTPTVAMTGPLASYVYSDLVYLPVPIDIPADAKAGPITLKAHAELLVCKDVCVPESADLAITLPVSAGSSAPDPTFGTAVEQTLALAPKPAGLNATFQAVPGKLTLSVAGAAVKGAAAGHAWFFPFDGSVMEPAKPQLVQTGPDGLTFTLTPGVGFSHPDKLPATLDGVISIDGGHAYEIAARPGPALPQTFGSAAPKASTPPDGHGAASAASGGSEGAFSIGQLLFAVGGAVLGGLILNLMPCVFPILAMKAAALARHAEHPGKARAEGLAFAGGVLATFIGLAALLLAVRAAGQEVGWGFQLQSPAVIAVLCLVILLSALNLSGLFEAGVSLQGVGAGGLADKGGLVGAAFTGVLAVVVAAPCTAPFMAPAIGWAVTQPPLAALLVFAFLGVGLAAPFTLVAFVPGLFKVLPKPGAWMEGFRKVLAFPMYGTAAWLAWVFVLQAGDTALAYLFAAALAVAFGAWMWGVGQRSEMSSGKAPWMARAIAAAALIAAIPAVVYGASLTAAAPASGSSASAGAAGSLPTELWSPDRVAELQSQGRPVFVDFTAAWCVTCQVNERTALATKGVTDAFTRTNAVYLKADWTKRDPMIAQALSAQGRSGVPLYLIYSPTGAAPVVMPQLLTEGMVVQALDTAAKKPA